MYNRVLVTTRLTIIIACAIMENLVIIMKASSTLYSVIICLVNTK